MKKRRYSPREVAAMKMNNNKVIKDAKNIKKNLMTEEHLDSKIIQQGKKERTEIKKIRKDMCQLW